MELSKQANRKEMELSKLTLWGVWNLQHIPEMRWKIQTKTSEMELSKQANRKKMEPSKQSLWGNRTFNIYPEGGRELENSNKN